MTYDPVNREPRPVCAACQGPIDDDGACRCDARVPGNAIATPTTVVAVLRRYADWMERQPEIFRHYAASMLNGHLDDLLRDDAFGTEGQFDPRGDRRG